MACPTTARPGGQKENTDFGNPSLQSIVTNNEFPAYNSPFGEKSLFNQSDWKRRLERFLSEQNISEFIYSNSAFPDDIPFRIRIRGLLINGELKIEINSFTNKILSTELNKGTDYVIANTELKHLKNTTHFLVYKLNGKWNICSKYIDERLVSKNVMGLIYGTQNLNDDDYKQIYYEFQDCKRSKSEDLKKKFNKFCQNINNQLAKKFYADVDVAAYVKLVDENGKPILENTLKSNYNKKQNDIKLNITLHSDGRIEIKHEISPGYLSEYEEKWKKEAKARGMEVDITAMRQDIIKFLESEEAELSFGKEFLREIRTWYDESVGGYIEAIQATQKVIGNVWKEGTINQSTWFSKDDEHRQWPEYMHFNPIVGGATDGIIDEIVGLPMACKSVYELATDDEKRKALGKVFTKEGFSQMLEGLKKEYEELKKDEEKRGHFGGKTAVSIISMISGAGFISKAGKTDEFIDITEDVTKRIDDVPDIKLGHLDDIKNDKKILHNPENRKTINEFFESQNIKYIEELSEEIAEDIDLKNLAITNPKKFILGKKLENEISEKIRKELSEGSEEIIEKIAQNSGITFSELRGMQHMSQLQLKLPNGGFTVIDDVFVKEVKDIISNKTVGFELILSETKLSSLSPFTIRQNEFIKALQTNTTEFITRSKKSEAIDIFKQQGTKVTIKKYLKVIGDGSENISNIKIETIF